ncbi:MAG: hypothetical protein K2X81_05250, partial [Candidatus Obscuribacterales bacterium]|nr:hypothetical protein [Candidatus Obscuribacterales bacterium]
MTTQSNTNMTADWTKPAMVLLIVQILMVLALIAFVRSPWYGEFFNMRMRGMLVGGYRDSSNINGLKRALVYSKSSNRKVYEDLEIIDEIALHSSLKNTADWTKRLSTFSNDKNEPALVREIAIEKELRNELRIAKLAIANDDIDKADRSKTTAARLLALPYDSQTPRVNIVRRFLSLSAAIAQIKGDEAKSSELRRELSQLDAPSSAKVIYTKYKISGYAVDFSPTYRIQYLMKAIEKASSPQLQGQYLREAIEICKGKTLTYPLKVAILLKTQIHASINKDNEVLKQVFDIWCADCSNRLPSSTEEAYLLSGFQSTAIQESDPSKSILLLRRLLDCAEQGRFSKEQTMAFFRDFTHFSASSGLFYPSSANANELLELNLRTQKIAKKFG